VSADAATAPARLDSLDVLRGLTIAAMILVSTPGTWSSVYVQLDHAAWNGWTFTDLVFPFLLFAMGAAVPLALARRRRTNNVALHIVRRALILFALGLVLNAIEMPPPLVWAAFRIPGVLQRIAIVFLVVAWLTERTTIETQVVCAVGLLLGYWAAMTLVPVPGVGAGVLTPNGNLASYIDRALFGRHILNKWGDPEGLLSTIPAIGSALAGVFAGDWLQQHGGRRAAWLWICGLTVMLAGLAWGRAFPLNKNLWTSSFVLFSAGLAAQLLALLHWIVDLKQWRLWTRPFAAFGRNPLLAYFFSVGLDSLLTRWNAGGGASLKGVIYRATFAAWLRPAFSAETASLAYAITYVLLWAVILTELHRRRVFFSI
jgi:predicted acyltransferase